MSSECGRPARGSSLSIAAAAVVLCCAGAGFAAENAEAGNTYSIYHFDVLTSTTTYPGGPFVLSTDLARRYKWIVDTAHSTRVSYNYTGDIDIYEIADIPAHSQTAQEFTRDTIGKPGFQDFPVLFRGYARERPLYDRNGSLLL